MVLANVRACFSSRLLIRLVEMVAVLSVNKEISAIPSSNLHAHHNAATDVELLPSQPMEMKPINSKETGISSRLAQGMEHSF